MEALEFDGRNARLHDEKNKAAVGSSISELGAGRSIVVDRDGVIIGGNATYEQAKKLGMDMEFVHTKGDRLVVVVRDDLGTEDPKRKALAVADNRTAEMAEWDVEVLQELLDELPEDLAGVIGFDAGDLDDLFGDDGITEFDNTPVDDDTVPELEEKAITEPGKVYQLGRHRLICGDSTDATVVGTLLGGAKPGLMVTDPPYGVEYDPSWRKDTGLNNTKRVGMVQNDGRADWQAAWDLFPGDVAYVYHAGLHTGTVGASLVAAALELKSQIIWDKERLCISRCHYHWQHEPAWFCVRKGKTAKFCGGRKQTTVWRIPMVTNHNQDMATEHGTQKPLECMARPMRNHEFDEVYEPFCGSGTTLIAAEKVGKTCFAVELDPRYCDLIVRRYCKLMDLDPAKVFEAGVC